MVIWVILNCGNDVWTSIPVRFDLKENYNLSRFTSKWWGVNISLKMSSHRSFVSLVVEWFGTNCILQLCQLGQNCTGAGFPFSLFSFFPFCSCLIRYGKAWEKLILFGRSAKFENWKKAKSRLCCVRIIWIISQHSTTVSKVTQPLLFWFPFAFWFFFRRWWKWFLII